MSNGLLERSDESAPITLSPIGEPHLLKTLVEHMRYYNESRTHRSLEGDSPIGRSVETEGDIVATPSLGGLHHCYSRTA